MCTESEVKQDFMFRLLDLECIRFCERLDVRFLWLVQ